MMSFQWWLLHNWRQQQPLLAIARRFGIGRTSVGPVLGKQAGAASVNGGSHADQT
jgi:hypothetical protein